MPDSCSSCGDWMAPADRIRSEEHTSELQSQSNLVCRLLLEKKKEYKVLHPLSLNYSTNIFAQLPYALFIKRNCLDGIPFGGYLICQGGDCPRATSIAITIFC